MEQIRTPSCPDCGCSTVPSYIDHTVTIGGEGEVRTEPMVRAVITVNIPVYTCARPNCQTFLIGREGTELLEKVTKSVRDNTFKK